MGDIPDCIHYVHTGIWRYYGRACRSYSGSVRKTVKYKYVSHGIYGHGGMFDDAWRSSANTWYISRYLNAGCRSWSNDSYWLDSLLFGESQSRVLISVSPENLSTLLELAAQNGVSAAELGQTGGTNMEVAVDGLTQLKLPLRQLKKAWQEAIPCAMK